MHARAKLPAHLAVLLLGSLLAALLYIPGLGGSWLLDDQFNLGVFNNFAAGTAPYRELIFGNVSGPLGRPVSMASFALNHSLGLFSTPALKATNLLIHLVNGVLVFLLLARLFRVRIPGTTVAPAVLASLIAVWWLLLPIHNSTVLYIVQRMTELAAFFALTSCLAYTAGRQQLQAGRRRGWLGVAAALLLLLPLSVLAKENGACTVAWLALIELFFFARFVPGRPGLRAVLLALVVLTVVAAVVLVAALPIRESYLGRDFSLGERLLTQPRALWNYIGTIFLPDSARMGIVHDDFTVSQSLLSPWTTLPALIALLGLLATALATASSPRWWPVAFGLLLFLAGHLVESTLAPLELYFEHRNYLPALGLLLAALTVPLHLWRKPLRLPLLAFGVYLALLGCATLQRAHIWGRPGLLHAVSAVNHPHSLRAWSEYAEFLLAGGQPQAALDAQGVAADRNPAFAGLSYLHMVSMHCRLNQAPPARLLQAARAGLAQLRTHQKALEIVLEDILRRHRRGECGAADFAPLAPGLRRQDELLRERFGPNIVYFWKVRFAIAEALVAGGHRDAALDIFRDIWLQGNKADIPTVGLVLAEQLHAAGRDAETLRVLDEVVGVSADAPADFHQQINQLRQDATRQP